MVSKLSQIANAPSSPAITDKIVGVGAGNNDYLYSVAQLAASIVSASAPQGRLTLQSGAAVQTADQTAKSTVYYDSYIGNLVPVWNGSIWVPLTITSDEVSFGLATANVLSGSIYDIFAVNNSGSLALVVGPAWSSTSSRGTGAGTTELQRLNGIWTNKNALTHAYGGAAGTTDFGTVSANQATYLGSLYGTAAGQTSVTMTPTSAAGGSNNFVALFNAYHRTRASSRSVDSTNTWSYASATPRASNGSNGNRVTWLDGLQVISPRATHTAFITAGSQGTISIGWDSTSVPGMQNKNQSVNVNVCSVYESQQPLLGLHFAQSLEFNPAASSTTFVGFGIFESIFVDLEI